MLQHPFPLQVQDSEIFFFKSLIHTCSRKNLEHFHKLYQFLLNCDCTKFKLRHRDHIGKENITISLANWKIIMFDHKGVKTVKKFQFSFCMSTLKSWSLKKHEVIGLACTTLINSWLFKIYSTIFLNEFLMWFFLQDLGSFPRALNTTGSQNCNGYPCTKSWIKKS